MDDVEAFRPDTESSGQAVPNGITDRHNRVGAGGSQPTNPPIEPQRHVSDQNQSAVLRATASQAGPDPLIGRCHQCNVGGNLLKSAADRCHSAEVQRPAEPGCMGGEARTRQCWTEITIRPTQGIHQVAAPVQQRGELQCDTFCATDDSGAANPKDFQPSTLWDPRRPLLS